MKMYFHQRVGEVILWRSWIPTTNAEYAGSVIAIILMGVTSMVLRAIK